MARWFHDRDSVRAPHAEVRPARPARTDEQVRAFLRLLPRYRVVLHNDDRHTLDQIIAALLRTIPALARGDAERITQEAHSTGCSEVIVCPKELAEHYRAQLWRHAITSSIEPA